MADYKGNADSPGQKRLFMPRRNGFPPDIRAGNAAFQIPVWTCDSICSLSCRLRWTASTRRALIRPGSKPSDVLIAGRTRPHISPDQEFKAHFSIAFQCGFLLLPVQPCLAASPANSAIGAPLHYEKLHRCSSGRRFWKCFYFDTCTLKARLIFV
jgi:hypothetical protein